MLSVPCKMIPALAAGLFAILLLSSCKKNLQVEPNDPSVPGFVKYTIKAGHQYADPNPYTKTEYTELRFIVRFDSSAIYQTRLPANQLDINKLLGFSDNGDEHHHFSARFGWRWSDNALRLFAYVYNNSERTYEEITSISIGDEHACAIKISGSEYRFTVNQIEKTMPRASSTTPAKGYKLYPYFGGDESAPHDISIWIREY